MSFSWKIGWWDQTQGFVAKVVCSRVDQETKSHLGSTCAFIGPLVGLSQLLYVQLNWISAISIHIELSMNGHSNWTTKHEYLRACYSLCGTITNATCNMDKIGSKDFKDCNDQFEISNFQLRKVSNKVVTIPSQPPSKMFSSRSNFQLQPTPRNEYKLIGKVAMLCI